MSKNLALCLIALAVAGCSSGSKDASTASSTAPAAHLKVVYIPKSAGNPYFDQIEAGFQAASKQFGFDFEKQAPTSADATSQVSIINDEVQRGVDVLAISANSPDALDDALDDARAKGVLVMTVDADLTGNESHRDGGVLPVDFSKVGASQIELLGKLMNYQGDFAILSATSDAPNQNVWIGEIKDELKQPKYAKMRLVEVVYGDDEPQKSSTETEGLLAKYPNLKGILAPTSVGLAAAAQVVENAGVYPGGSSAKNGGLILTGLSTPNQLKKAVDKGVVQAFQLWSPYDAGYLCAYMGVEAKEKKLEIKPGATVNIPGKPAVAIGDKNIAYAGPLLTFDKTNIAKYNF
jgi:rhamnose transport system substrate-binding protein